MLRKLIVKTEESKETRISKIVKLENLKFNVGSTEKIGRVVNVKEVKYNIVILIINFEFLNFKTTMKVELNQPICT